MRNSSKTNGTVDIETEYFVNRTQDAQLKNLINPNTGSKYNYASAKDDFPAMAQRAERLGWSQQEFLNLYKIEAAALNAILVNDTYMGVGGYVHPTITQSRATILLPHGWYLIGSQGIMHGLNRIIGRGPNVYSDRSGNNQGSTPGTALQIDSANWNTARFPDRIIAPSSAWKADFSVVGGLAYQEGIGFEGIRFVGGTDDLPLDPAYKSHGATLTHPGENSFFRDCMFTGFNGSALVTLGSTPCMMERCSWFNCDDYGLEWLGNNGLSNLLLLQPSGDNNRKALIGCRPLDGNNVGGGTITILGSKNEGRGIAQQLFRSEGKLGQLTMTVVGVTLDYNSVTCENAIELEQGDHFQVEVSGLMYGGSLTNLFKHKARNWSIPSSGAFRGVSFGVNDEGLYMKSRSNVQLVGAGTTPPVDPPVEPPATVVFTLSTSVPVGSDSFGPHPWALAVDGSASSYALSNRGMQVGDEYTFSFALRPVKSFTSVAPAYYQNSFARKFDIYLWIGGQWQKQSTTPYNGAFTSVATFAAKTTTQLKFVVREANPNWLGFSNVTLG